MLIIICSNCASNVLNLWITGTKLAMILKITFECLYKARLYIIEGETLYCFVITGSEDKYGLTFNITNKQKRATHENG